MNTYKFDSMKIDKRLDKTYSRMIMSEFGNKSPISAGIKSLDQSCNQFALTQASWRFYSNETVTPIQLSIPLIAEAKKVLGQEDSEYVLGVHDWSSINYNRYKSKKDRLQISHDKHVGYDLQGCIFVSAITGNPLAVPVQDLVSCEGVWQSRSSSLIKHPRNEKGEIIKETHLNWLTERMNHLGRCGFEKIIINIIDREADSIGHQRCWNAAGMLYLLRAKGGNNVTYNGIKIKISKVADSLQFTEIRKVICKGKDCVQWIGEADIIITRDAKSKHKDGSGKRIAPQPGEPLALRLVVSHIYNKDKQLVAEWFLLSNVDKKIEAQQIALWYYFRWQIETFFKLLKSAGHHLERWQQETARAIFLRLLIVSQACTIVWQLANTKDQSLQKVTKFLVRISGRQMKAKRPITAPALTEGLFMLLTMLNTLENISLGELNEYGETIRRVLFKEQRLGRRK